MPEPDFSRMLQLKGKFTIEIDGDVDTFLASSSSRDAMTYLFTRLFSGDEIAPAEFEVWGLRVREG